MKNPPLIFLRFGLGITFLIFGIGKFMNDIWAKTITSMDFYKFLGGGMWIVYLIGAVEVLIALALILNFRVKLFAAIASLELITILILLKFSETRDIGLLGASLALMFMTKDRNVEKDLKRESLARGKGRFAS